MRRSWWRLRHGVLVPLAGAVGTVALGGDWVIVSMWLAAAVLFLITCSVRAEGRRGVD